MRRPRSLAPPLCALLALLATPASAEDAPKASHSLTGGVITNPAGLYTQYTYSHPLGRDGWYLGAFSNFLVYSNELGAQLQYKTDPAYLEVHLDLAFEPGVFRQLPGRSAQGSDPPARTAGWRAVGRAQSNLNLQFAWIWFYSRTTALLRYRNFVEQDTIQNLVLEREWSIEQATATFFRLAGTPPVLVSPNSAGPALWTYAEWTVGGLWGVGTRPNRLSAGLLTERWPWPGAVFNLDFYYSFAQGIRGPGAIFVYWLYW
jgi:hypothetical protein